MKLKYCPSCKKYTLKENCDCDKKTKSAHYKFVKTKTITKSPVSLSLKPSHIPHQNQA